MDHACDERCGRGSGRDLNDLIVLREPLHIKSNCSGVFRVEVVIDLCRPEEFVVGLLYGQWVAARRSQRQRRTLQQFFVACEPESLVFDKWTTQRESVLMLKEWSTPLAIELARFVLHRRRNALVEPICRSREIAP